MTGKIVIALLFASWGFYAGSLAESYFRSDAAPKYKQGKISCIGSDLFIDHVDFDFGPRIFSWDKVADALQSLCSSGKKDI